jgi:hypothetical protein
MTMQSTGGFETPRVTAECTRQTGTAGQSRVSGRRIQLFFHPMGAGAPAHPSIFFPLGLCRDVSLPAKKFSTFFRSDGTRSAAEAKRFSDSDRSYIIHINGFTPFHSRSALHRIATANEGPITVKN